MVVPSEKLMHLKEYAAQLSDPQEKNRETIRQAALKIISDLNADLRNKNLQLEEWNEIFQVIQPYTKLDLSEEKGGIINTIKSLFDVFSGSSENKIDSLVNFVNEKRVQCTKGLFDHERSIAIKEHQQFIHNVIAPTRNEIREHIIGIRSQNPRFILSVQDEVMLLRELINTELKKLEDPLSREGKNLQRMLDMLQGGLFAFDNDFEKALMRERHETGAVVLQSQPEALGQAAIEKLRVQRLYRLENLEAVYRYSVSDPNQRVASKCFEPTCGWYVGAFQFNRSYAPFEVEMERIGQEHGIKVVSDIKIDSSQQMYITEDNKTELMLDCESIIILKEGGNSALGAFAQDFVDFSKNGEIRIPSMQKFEVVETFLSYSEVDICIEKDRAKRSGEWNKLIENMQEETPFHYLGIPHRDALSLKAIALASSLDKTPIMNLTYNEGGNTLIGKRGGQSYALIGRDSYAVSKMFMEDDLGREMTHDEVCMAFAIDYGIPKENIYFIEQPGDFHLDMSMTIIGENTILLNNAEEAQERFAAEQQVWLAEAINDRPEHEHFFTSYVRAEIEQVSARKIMEDVVEQDLTKLGFNVVRVPGRFHYSSHSGAMNLFNMVTAKTPSGENIVVLLGCIGEYGAFFEGVIRAHCDQKIDRIYFLDLESSQDCLIKGGGISCRTKTIPLPENL
ncbi:MAG: hypothetical protein WA347_07895 [Rhabdochlamydiaceae bacterium]